MKRATVLHFPKETAAPVPHPERWIVSLEYKIPTLDPLLAVVREHGKPARTIRLDPEPPPSIYGLRR